MKGIGTKRGKKIRERRRKEKEGKKSAIYTRDVIRFLDRTSEKVQVLRVSDSKCSRRKKKGMRTN